MTKKKYVTVTAVWGKDDAIASIKIPTADWRAIERGETWRGSSKYFYEGSAFTADWTFNREGRPGTLLLTYDDAGVGYDGDIDGVRVEE